MPKALEDFSWGDHVPKGKVDHSAFPEIILPKPLPAIPLKEKTQEEEAKLRLWSNEIQQRLDSQDALDALARSLEPLLHSLESIAKRGDQGAFEYLYLIAARCIRALEKGFAEHPNGIKATAGQQILWPALVSTKDDLTQRNTKHIDKINLGVELGIKLQNSRWGFDNAYTKHAFALLRWQARLKSIALTIEQLKTLNSPEAGLLTNKLLMTVSEDERSFLNRIVALPPLNKGTISEHRPLLKDTPIP